MRVSKATFGLMAALCAATALLSEPSLTQNSPQSTYDRPTIEHGAQLVAVGDCASCHSTSDGMPFAGGVALATPFGTVYGTNITPDTQTGIGAWTQDDFNRAMRTGVARGGQRLYPV